MIVTQQIEKPDYTIKKDGKTINIYQDTDPETPRMWDNVGIMVTWHRRYSLGDEQPTQDPEEWIKDNKKEAVVILPLYLYDHGGLSISTSPYGCSWDSGQVGFIYTTKEQLKKMGSEHEAKQRIKEILENEVKLYNQYLSGDVWRFEIEDGDAVGGFFGINDLLDCLRDYNIKVTKEDLISNF